MPAFWDHINGQCNRNIVIALRIGADALHIATDLLVTGVFLRIFMCLQMALRPKLEVVGIFLCRTISHMEAVNILMFGAIARSADRGNLVFASPGQILSGQQA
ncbi:uncharacterized protein FMAN_16273 [Fusarium mangiferae]|uniref:Uncharacterized protein n=1 Tax=Fusarium mangiferae TaxID=192010 RepID=A0A1L7UM47_FUSMA|nr:uncharacterized protein FMAN_16273 [Fusarium mangiferae]CVL09175.1 uncharacterized protein FMAN_16273 [Fusarium mangiferae]